ncbi:MAG: aldose epimerase family protein [Velocimicrobium sp.]
MSIQKRNFGKTKDGKNVTSYILKNANGMEAEFIDYGARLVRLCVPDAKGKFNDVVLGFDNIAAYEKSDTYYGAFIGRCANRIGGATYVLNDKTYPLDKNDGENTLHSGFVGYDKMMYEVETFEEEGEVSIECSRLSKHMEQGFPGNLDLTVSYTLSADNALVIEYFAVSDQDTLVNLTNHSYFNLSGHNKGDILNHKLKVDANKFAITTEDLIPTGEFRDVEGTPMDFRDWRRLGQDIDADYLPLKIAGGYDHHFVFQTEEKEIRLVLEALDETSGRYMEVYTDLPGCQIYTGNFIGGKLVGKEGCTYQKRAGFCVETQSVPDSIHLDNVSNCILKAGEEFDTTTVYKFGIK